MLLQSRFSAVLTASAIFISTVLLLDGVISHVILGAATAIFLFVVVRSSPVDGRHVLIAIVVATAGEIVLSIGWGLYKYQHALIPFYVPPGHGLFYLLAAEAAFWRPRWLQPRYILSGGTVLAVFTLIVFNDTWGFLWWLGALALIARSRNRMMFSACFVYTQGLEWVGTAIGNWRWLPEVPFVGLHSANPPSGVGILYVLLDIIAGWLAGYLGKASLTPPSTGNIAPVVLADLGPARNSAASATSVAVT
jgi:hypothetical protein